MPPSLSQRAYRRLYIALSLLLLLHFYALYTRYFPTNEITLSTTGDADDDTCPPLPALQNTLIVLKTGVTEAHAKLPIHRTTTLRCIPPQNYIVWSDYEESIADIPVHDVLYNESSHLHQLPEFTLYEKVRAQGRDALTNTDLADDISTPFGKSNPGWKLDKWKFVPMVEHTYRNYPGRDWYVFMEADTYILWKSMFAWLEGFDPSEPFYLGNQMQIRDVLFAHGGSGFVISGKAMERAAAELENRRDYWDGITGEEWAGDCVLGRLLKEAGVDLTWSWPMLQLAPPKEIDHFGGNYGRLQWCYPAVSFHHLKPREIEELAALERRWRKKNGNQVLLWRDVFYELGRPKMGTGPVEDWDCEAGEEKRVVKTAEECRRICELDRYCLQYVRRPDGMCAIGRDARVGEKRDGFTSGWMLERIDKVAKKYGTCPKTNWVTSSYS
ncbi:hypothetical protein BJY04DRAFT_192561 [Aspergillus karnatakaensis]|uniref:uncharacterized protein n=1 Tax=Aspergillus karnatakaensis TaxID=1810916 RepID=UPI003CCE1177